MYCLCTHKQNNIGPSVIKRSFIGYPHGTKDHMGWLLEERRCTISGMLFLMKRHCIKNKIR